MTIEPNVIYRIDGFTINAHFRQVVSSQQTLSVRPKTFSLLLAFLENPQQVLTKEFLLQKIWDDVAVEEQVLVQSIRELRQLFAPLDVIQTHPRKGYAWVAPVEKLPPPIEPVVQSQSQSQSRSQSKSVHWLARMPGVAILGSVVLLCVLGVFALKYLAAAQPDKKNIITVLPVENRTEGTSLSWVRLGLMDQLIQSLQLSPGVQVFDVPYVLHLLDVSRVDVNNRVQLANRIFEVSGSSLVVDLELSGSVNDYRLRYRLFTRTDQTSGVLIDSQLDKVVESLAAIVATKAGAQLDLSRVNAEFNSSLVGEAWEKWNLGQTAAAMALLNTAVTIEPENYLAAQLLIESTQLQQSWQQAKDHTRKIIAVGEPRRYSRIYVFYYLLARAEFALGEVEQARHSLFTAQQFAEQAYDSLYQAYIATLEGEIAQQVEDLETAEKFYQAAMGHHKTIACPIGVSLVGLKLMEVYKQQGRDDLFTEQQQQLTELVEKHKLPIDVLLEAPDKKLVEN